ncbi:papain cysteine protease family protein [Tribonema minus]|uniref:Papain cysteine protease family protein n=1 Tax=Tribonema minus TaxID=303371 RepID=A0A836CMZ0_9STRA|nr:papain cysteine protease family protein [Tribonema minus]
MISTSGPLIDKLLETNAARLEKFERTEAGDAKKPAHLPASAGGRRYGTIKQKEDSRDYSFVASFRNSIPQKVDLRSTGFLGPVLNQGSAGTCSAHAAAAALRYLLRKEHVQDFPPSRLFVYYTTRVNIEGISPEIDSGCVLRDVCRALQKFHTCNERYMAYSDTQITERPPALAVANARLHTTFAYRAVEQTLSALRGALATGYPVIVGIQVYQTFESEEVANTGVVPMPSHNEECLGGHAVLLVAYDDETRTFTLQNSWGEWGQDGFFSLPYDYLIDTGLAGDFWCLTRFA